MQQDQWPSQYFNDISLISHPIGLNYFWNTHRLKLYKTLYFIHILKSISEFLNNEKERSSEDRTFKKPEWWYANKNPSWFKWWDWFKNNQTMVPNDTSVWLYQIVKSTSCSTFRNNEGQNIQKVKHRLRPKKRVSARKLSMDLRISERNVRRIMKNDLGLRSYKKVIEPLLSNDQKSKQKNICKLDSNKFSKRRNYENSLFRWKTYVDMLMGVYNSQNDWMWAVGRADADKKGEH